MLPVSILPTGVRGVYDAAHDFGADPDEWPLKT
jgi:hypothetical protein